MSRKAFKQGIFTPTNPHRYVGNSRPIYRSSWELKLFLWLDSSRNKNVLKWSSESVVIPYLSPIDGKVHRYFVDNVAHIQEGNKVVKYLIEVKPKKQTQPPTVSKRKKQSTILYENTTYVINQAKWKHAIDWCNRNGYKWLLLTEDVLFSNES